MTFCMFCYGIAVYHLLAQRVHDGLKHEQRSGGSHYSEGLAGERMVTEPTQGAR